MRCVVTGAAGFIGSTLSERLLRDGHEVIGVDCFLDYYPKPLKLKNIERAQEYNRYSFREENLLEIPMQELLEGVDWVFHQAAQAGVRASWGEDFQIYTENNIRATQRILESAKLPHISKHLKKIIFASSSSVYGNAETLPTAESIRPQPVSPYGVTKLAAEHLMVLYNKEFNLPTVSLRYFTVYGPRQRPDMAFHKFIRASLKGEKIHVYGDGTQTRDFTFIDDIVEANILAAKSSGGELVYNIGGGSRVGLQEVITLLGKLLGGKTITVEHQGRQAGDARNTGADITFAKKILGFSPQTSLAEGLKKEISWVEQMLASDLIK